MHLPRGWEEGITPEGVKYYIDHNVRCTTFVNPVTGIAEACDEPISYWEHSRNGNQRSRVPFQLRQIGSAGRAAAIMPAEGKVARLRAQTVSASADGQRADSGSAANASGYSDSSFYQPDDSVFHQDGNADPCPSQARWSSYDDIHKVRAWHQQQQPLSQPAPGRPSSGASGGGSHHSAQHDTRSDHSTAVLSKAGGGKQGRRKKKLAAPGVRRRKPDSPVAMKGWLHKLESGGAGLKVWRKRYCILSEFCLFLYKDDREDDPASSSILLPSYSVNPVTARDDGITRKFAFKAEHGNMKTHYFAAEGKEDLSRWMNAMSLAGILQRDPVVEQEFNRTDGDGMPAPAKAGPTAAAGQHGTDDGSGPGSSMSVAWREQHRNRHQDGQPQQQQQQVSDPEWQWPQPRMTSAFNSQAAVDPAHHRGGSAATPPLSDNADRWLPAYDGGGNGSSRCIAEQHQHSLPSYENVVGHWNPAPGHDAADDGIGRPPRGSGRHEPPGGWSAGAAAGAGLGQWERDRALPAAPHDRHDRILQATAEAAAAGSPAHRHGGHGGVQHLHSTADYENLALQPLPFAAAPPTKQNVPPASLGSPAAPPAFADTNPFRSAVAEAVAPFHAEKSLDFGGPAPPQQREPLAPWQQPQQRPWPEADVTPAAAARGPAVAVDEPPWRRAHKQVPSYRPPPVLTTSPANGSDRFAGTSTDSSPRWSSAAATPIAGSRGSPLDTTVQQHDQLDYVNISPPAAFSSSSAATVPMPGDGPQHGRANSAILSGELAAHRFVPAADDARGHVLQYPPQSQQAAALSDAAALVLPTSAASPTRSSSSSKGPVNFTKVTTEDLSGRSHEQLVLLLIELRRQFSQAEAARDAAQTRCQRARGVLSLAHSSNSSIEAVLHRKEADELASYVRSIDEQIEAQRPVVAMVDELVRMGSPHGAQNAEMADRSNRNLFRRRVPSHSEQPSGSPAAQPLQQLHPSPASAGQVVHAVGALSAREQSVTSGSGSHADWLRREVEAAMREQHALLGMLTFTQRQMEEARSGLLEQLRRTAAREPSPRITDQLERVDAELAAGDRSIDAVTKRLQELALRKTELDMEAADGPTSLLGPGGGTGHLAAPSDSAKAPGETFYQRRSAASTASNGPKPVSYGLEGGSRSSQRPLPFEAYQDQWPSASYSLPLPPSASGTYFETDLDSMVTKDIALPSPVPAQPSDSRDPYQPVAGEWDIGEADDSTKRFFGILPKEKARSATTVRDVKRAAAAKLRLEQQKDISTTDGLSSGAPAVATRPVGLPSSSGPPSVQGRFAAESSTSLHFAPAHVPAAASGYLGNGTGAVGGGGAPLRGGGSGPGGHPAAAAAAAVLPAASAFRAPQAGFRRMGNGRVRYLTISSSQPLSFEAATLTSAQARAGWQDRDAESVAANAANRSDSRRTAASSGSLVNSIDLELSAPRKVVIPERYVPDAEDAAEPTDEEKRARAHKAERLRKMLSAQSLQEWTRAEISPAHASTTNSIGTAVGDRLVVEKKRRETVLEMRHMLAQEVSLKTREAAAAQKLRCRSQESLPRSVNSQANRS